MKVSILGLGYVGLPLARELQERNYSVSGSTTSVEKRIALQRENVDVHLLRSPDLPPADLLAADVVIINIPPSEGQPEWLAQWDLSRTGKIIFVSSTSVLKETSHSPVLKREEEWVKTSGKPWLIVRPGGLIGRGRHPGKHLSGKKNLRAGRHPVNLIHVDDVIGFLITALEKGIASETIELVSDEHHSRQEFYTEFCQRTGIPIPEFDETDESPGPIVPNEKMKKYYELKFPTMLGKSL